MSGDFGDDFFTPPAFKPDESLSLLKRQLRDLRPLAERGQHFELNGKAVVDLAVDNAATAIVARVARRPATSPEWDTLRLKSSADVRKCADEVRKRLAAWQDDAR